MKSPPFFVYESPGSKLATKTSGAPVPQASDRSHTELEVSNSLPADSLSMNRAINADS